MGFFNKRPKKEKVYSIKESKEFIEKIFQNIVKENGMTKGCPN